MKKIVFFLLSVALLASCASNPKQKQINSYQDAEEAFLASLSGMDTTTVVAITNSFLQMIKDGQTEAALKDVHVLYQGVLYKAADEYLDQLRSRFANFPIYSYKLERFSFSTPGNNDCVYSYTFSEPVEGQKDKTMKIVFNPVFVEGSWYITLKDGNQSSLDLPEGKQVPGYSPAPGELKLNRQ